MTDSPTQPTTPWTGVGMDPRLRARRVAVMRAAGRRRLHRLMALAGMVLLVLTALAVSYSPAVAVQDVRFEGVGRLDEAQLRAVAHIRDGSSLAWLDTEAVEARLEALPGVADAHVRRAWPHGVVVEIDERRPVAVIADQAGGWVEVDADGRVLGPTAQPGAFVPLEGLPPLGADQEALDPAGLELVRVAASLPATLASRVRAVGTGDTGPTLLLQPTGTVLLHDADDLAQKFLATLVVLAEVDDAEVQVLDVGVPGSPVLRRADP